MRQQNDSLCQQISSLQQQLRDNQQLSKAEKVKLEKEIEALRTQLYQVNHEKDDKLAMLEARLLDMQAQRDE